MKPARTRSQTGYSLIMAIVVLLVLTIVGLRALETVNSDIVLAGNDRSATTALYIAEAGVADGIDRLRQSPFNFEAPSPSFDTALDDTNAPPVTGGNGCDDSSCPIFGWHQLTAGPVSYGGGTYWVVVNDDDEGDGNDTADTNHRVLLRSMATDARGARRMVEVALGVE